MDLAALKAYLDQLNDGTLTLDAADAALPEELRDYLDTCPLPVLTLSPAAPDGIRLEGALLTVEGSSTDAWPVQNMLKASIGLSYVTLTIEDEGGGPPVFETSATGTLPITPSASARVAVRSPQDAEPAWTVALAGDAPSLTATELLEFGVTGPLPVPLPPSLDVLDRALVVSEDNFGIKFYPQTTRPYEYTFGVSAPDAKWVLVQDVLTVGGIDLSAYLTRSAFGCVVLGHTEIGGVPVDVGVALNMGPNWLAFVQPGGGRKTFPGLGALADLAAGSGGSSAVTAGFANVGFDLSAFDLGISRVAVGFNWGQLSLNFIEVVSVLTIRDIDFDLTARLPEFSLTGSLRQGAPIKVKEMLESFGVDAAAVPEGLTVTEIVLTSRPANTFYSLSVTVEEVWTVGPFDLEEVKATVTYAGGPSGPGFTGQFDCTLIVANVDLWFAADYSGKETGWAFNGRTLDDSGINIGDLMADLGDKFGIEFPAPVEGLELKNLEVSYETGTGKFTFACEGDLTVEEMPVAMVVRIEVNPLPAAAAGGAGQAAQYEYKFGGKLTVGPLEFDLVFDEKDATSNIFVATYSHAGEQASVNLHELVAAVSTDLAGLVPSGLNVDLKDVKFVYYKDALGTKFAFGLNLGTGINLSALPLVGSEFPADQTVGVDDLQVMFASKEFTQTEAETLNELIPEGVTRLPTRAQSQTAAPSGGTAQTQTGTAVALQSGLTISAAMNFGGSVQPLALPMAGGTSASATTTTTSPPPGTTGATPSQPPADGTKWFTLQKAFGPVYFEKVGVQYQNSVVWFVLNASMTAAGLTLSLDGLGVGSPVDKFDPEFKLRGLGIDYKGGGTVEIGGTFLRVEGTDSDGQKYDEYDGAAVIKATDLTLSAIGSYARLNGHPSLFVYAVLDYPLGGPSFFFVTGLAAGFGYNRSLTVPAIDRVAQFPLVAEAVSGTGTRNSLTQELQSLHTYIPPAVGEVFLAFGVKFTSFKLIDSFVLLTVAFGTQLEVNVLGLSTLVVPTPEAGKSVTPLAKVQMAVKATYLPDQGFLGVTAQLTSASYILSRNCRLTGGFAFYSWFSGKHKGEFVQTLGGYHPSFKAPDYYPQVPRLGFNWRVDRELTLKGEAYYALTASTLMAGGYLQATWESGDLKARFNAGADFIISWKPYHYDAKIHIDAHVSYTFNFFGKQHIKVDVGAKLHIWGPDFAGTAHIDISVISFDISFGSSKAQTPKPISWSAFKSSFLPAADAVCSISLKEGLVSVPQEAGDLDWVINPKRFVIVTDSLIPAMAAFCGPGDKPVAAPHTTAFGIGPMAVSADHLTTSHTVTITREGATEESAEAEFEFIPVLKRVPVGLWGQSLTPSLKGPAFVEQALTGFEIRPGGAPAPGETADIACDTLRYDPAVVSDAYAWADAAPFVAGAAGDEQRREAIRESLSNEDTIAAREKLLTDLGVSAAISLNPAAVADAFTVAPQVGAAAE